MVTIICFSIIMICSGFNLWVIVKSRKQDKIILAQIKKVKQNIDDIEILGKVRRGENLTFEETARHILLVEEMVEWNKAGRPNIDEWRKNKHYL